MQELTAAEHPLTHVSAVIQVANQACELCEQEPQHNREWLNADRSIADECNIVKFAQDAMEAARRRMLRQEDSKSESVVFFEGSQVCLKTTYLGVNMLPSQKLFPLWLGPLVSARWGIQLHSA